ncbi:hypothetical protein ZHAS_00002666 [Anopheles sinensis]|uniref:Fibrinogen C-terminal domain-containing protein n=1 Tax=Anopheles sinensis TaxID=74873 RepID=A0A084VCL6_ANOSI|nr:hypothetical protein ZHAS_00002666 [Anopheles sinensis]
MGTKVRLVCLLVTISWVSGPISATDDIGAGLLKAKLDFLQEKLQEIEHNLLSTMDRKLDHLRNKLDELEHDMKARDEKLDLVEHSWKEVGSTVKAMDESLLNKVSDFEESMKTRDDLWEEIARGMNTTHTNSSFQLEDKLTTLDNKLSTLEDKLTTKLNNLEGTQQADFTKLKSETKKLLDLQAEYVKNHTSQMEHIANTTESHSCLKLGDLEGKLTAKLNDLEGKQQADLKKLQTETKKLFDLQTEYIKNQTTRMEGPGICKNASMTGSGIYQIQLTPQQKISAYCEQGSFGGGWLVFQHRFNGQVSFDRGWTEYRNGFGNLGGEFWLGLEYLHKLTTARKYELIVEVKDYHGNYGFARYSEFEVGSEGDGYSLSLGKYTGTAGDSFTIRRYTKFSTKDKDNDNSSISCTSGYGGAWCFSC